MWLIDVLLTLAEAALQVFDIAPSDKNDG